MISLKTLTIFTIILYTAIFCLLIFMSDDGLMTTGFVCVEVLIATVLIVFINMKKYNKLISFAIVLCVVALCAALTAFIVFSPYVFLTILIITDNCIEFQECFSSPDFLIVAIIMIGKFIRNQFNSNNYY